MFEERRFDSPKFLTRFRECEHGAWKALTDALRERDGQAWDVLVDLFKEGHDKNCKALKERAFEALYEVMWAQLVSRIKGFLKEETDPQGMAEDLAQETLWLVFLKINQFRGDSHFTTWVYRIASNKAISEIRERPPLLKEYDVYWRCFCSWLIHEGREALPSPGKRIWDLLPQRAREIVTAIAQTKSPIKNQQSELFNAIRNILKQRDFYEERCFRYVTGIDKIKTRLRHPENLSGKAVEKAVENDNHDLFRKSFAEYIAKCPKKRPINFSDLDKDSKENEGLPIPDRQPNPEERCYQEEMKEVAKSWVNTLSDKDKLLWKLRYDDKVTEKEVADLRKISEEEVRARFSILGKNLQKNNLTEQAIADSLNEEVRPVSVRLWQLWQELLEFLQPYLNEIDQWEWQGMQVVPDGLDGVVVIGVRAGSTAMKSGIEISDHIVMIGSMPVHNVAMFAIITRLEDTPGEITITVVRGHKQKKIALRCTKKK